MNVFAKCFGQLSLVVVLGCCASSAAGLQDDGYPAETILHYDRSNQDGSNVEKISVFLEGPTQVAVYKRRGLGTDAALVTGEFDPAHDRAVQLIGGRLKRDGSQDARAWLTHDPDPNVLHVRLGKPDGEPVESVSLRHDLPWRMFDFDFADWNAILAGSAPPREGIAVELVMAWPDAREGESLLRYLGELRGTFAGEEVRLDRATCRFDLHGDWLKADQGNAIWLDAKQGFVVEALLDVPNHPGYDDFRLALTGVETGRAQWENLLQKHFAGPAK